MLSGETCYVGAPDFVRDYMFLDDHVSAYVEPMKNKGAVGGAYNVSPGNPLTNAELASKLSACSVSKGRLYSAPIRVDIPKDPRIRIVRTSYLTILK